MQDLVAACPDFLYDFAGETGGDMDIERELTDDEGIMLHGHCHFFALAMHELTGYPLAAYVEYDMDIDRYALVHAFVVDGEDAIDVRGRMPAADIIKDEFDFWEPELITPTREVLLMYGFGRKSVSPNNKDFKRAMRVAEDVLSQLTAEPSTGVQTAPRP